jgi:hypothetical protein
MARQKAPTYTAKDVIRGLDIPHGTLNSWAFHGLFQGLDAEKTTPGKARKFTRADLYRLATMKWLMDFGISAGRANEWAIQCINYMCEAPIYKMTVLAYEDGWAIRKDDGSIPPFEVPGVIMTLTIYPAEIVRALDERLGIDTESQDRKKA